MSCGPVNPILKIISHFPFFANSSSMSLSIHLYSCCYSKLKLKSNELGQQADQVGVSFIADLNYFISV